VREHELGLTAARIRGIHESNGQLIVFVDDDNVIAPDYLEQALNVERAYPPLAVFGSGIISPEFEATPSDEVKRLVPLLCLRQVSEPRWSNNPEDNEGIPWGAGLCVRRPTADAYAQVLGALSISSSFDRRGQRLFSGGDDLFSWVAARTGAGFGIFPSLQITHLVRADRVKPPYLLRLVHDHAYSHAILRYVMCGQTQSAPQVADTIRILLHGVRRGTFSMQSRWAASRGAAAAARHIVENRLEPLPADAFSARELATQRASITSIDQAREVRRPAETRAVR